MKISFRQFSIAAFFLMLALKFLALPSIIYTTAKNDSWLVFVLIEITDFILVWACLGLMKSSHEKNFYEFVKHRLGVILAKIIFLVLIILFMFDMFIGITGLQRLMLENFYTEFNWLVFLLPLLIIMAFLAYKGLRNILRVSEIFVWIVISGFIFLILKGLPEFDGTFLLPFLSKGISPVIKSYFDHVSWFGSPLTLLFFWGMVDFSDGKKSVLLKYSLIATILVLVMVCLFYGVFGTTASLHSFALSDISQISDLGTALNEISWMVVLFGVVAQIIQLSLYLYCSTNAMRWVFHIKNSWLPILILNVSMIALQNINNEQIDLTKYFYHPITVWVEWIVKFGVLFVLIIVNWIYLAIKKRRKNVST